MPQAYRAQLLHQMYVTGLQFCVFVRGTPSTTLSTLVVNITEEQLERYEVTMSGVTLILGWLHVDYQRNQRERNLPEWLSDTSATILRSHFHFWDMVTSRILKADPLRPVDVFKHASQVMHHSAATCGFDGSTGYNAHISVESVTGCKFDFERNFALRTIIQVVVNAGVLWKLRSAATFLTGDNGNDSISERFQGESVHCPIRFCCYRSEPLLRPAFKRQFRKAESMKDFVREAGEQLLLLSNSPPPSPPPVPTLSDQWTTAEESSVCPGGRRHHIFNTKEIGELQAAVPDRHRLAFFNSPDGMKLR